MTGRLSSILQLREINDGTVTSATPGVQTPEGKFNKYIVCYTYPVQTIGGPLVDYLDSDTELLVCSGCSECKDITTTLTMKNDTVVIKCNQCNNEETINENITK